MKPLAALGLALLLVGALLGLRTTTLRPVGGASALCGAALIVYSLLPRRPKPDKRPYSWEDDERVKRRPEMYVPNPHDVDPRPRVPGREPSFTNPSPGTIPPQRGQVTTGPTEFAATAQDVPEPRQPGQTAPEFHATAGQVPDAAPGMRTQPTAAPIDPLLVGDSDLPPMAPPPPPPPPPQEG